MPPARRELQLRVFPLALLFLPQDQPSTLMPKPARRRSPLAQQRDPRDPPSFGVPLA